MPGDRPSIEPARSLKSVRPPVSPLIGAPLAPIYRAAVGWRNRRFDRGVGVTRLGLPVISVGNLSVGGTGKTPTVMHILGLLVKAGARPCVAMRGYQKRGSGATGPDEVDSYKRAFPGMPIVAQPDRIAGIRDLIESTPDDARLTCVVLDDGFQHRRIARDLDIVLVDASRPPFEDALLPAGWLREPVESLLRASIVVLTHAELATAPRLEALALAIARVRGGTPPEAVTRHVWTGLTRSTGAGAQTADEPLPLDWLLRKRVVACCAIGNPQGFLHSLQMALGSDRRRSGSLSGTLVLPDHDPFEPETVRTLTRMAAERGAEAIVVTDKDWSKLRHLPPATWDHRPVVRPRLSLVFDGGHDEFAARVVAAAGR